MGYYKDALISIREAIDLAYKCNIRMRDIDDVTEEEFSYLEQKIAKLERENIFLKQEVQRQKKKVRKYRRFNREARQFKGNHVPAKPLH